MNMEQRLMLEAAPCGANEGCEECGCYGDAVKALLAERGELLETCGDLLLMADAITDPVPPEGAMLSAVEYSIQSTKVVARDVIARAKGAPTKGAES